MTVSTHAPQIETKERLLEAAGMVFAERGFREATIREICRMAGANIAAVNYYFGDKERLYAEALQYGARMALERFPPDEGLADGAPPEEALYAFVRSFLRRFLESGQPEWHGRLCAREMVEPSAALDALVREIVVPLSARVSGIARALLGPKATDTQVRLCAMSVVGQCLLYHHHRPVLDRLYGASVSSPQDITRLARHITAFSLGAIRAPRDSKGS